MYSGVPMITPAPVMPLAFWERGGAFLAEFGVRGIFRLAFRTSDNHYFSLYELERRIPGEEEKSQIPPLF
jgi:hypothetical protein